ncbi:MAG: hypothetical protein KIT86_09975 [Hydrogenophaga sp.]|uniref:hypothetical protein n=1 Tax=Hydrogenophaga sp. TaxID=1904254 RepID=UPI0026171DFB|nr:hypothetical protein [Hydrogenophaga sp.]MCW5669980.1 hypothetical protein [Hydrogenophaga sp.]
MLRYIIGLFAALAASASFAATQHEVWYPNQTGWSTVFHKTAAESCQYYLANYWGVPYGSTTISGPDTAQCFQSGGTARGTVFRTFQTLSCTGGQVPKFSGSGAAAGNWQCVSTQCVVGQGRTFNRTEGWGRSSNPDANDLVHDYLMQPSDLYDYNDGVCVGNIATVQSCYRSQEPSSQGLYRLSCDYSMVITGESSTSGDTAASPLTPNASCPGFVGEVNGKTVCVGTAASPLPSVAAPDKPTLAGNPSAGLKPSSGEGSGSTGAGRTPTAGSGGNAGGPASASVGRGGTGARGEPGAPGEDASAVCGAPPLPACAVKVDETGTPAAADADSRFAQANTDLGKVQTDANDAFGDHRDISLPGWSWTFSFPTGCTALVLPAFGDLEIDVCQFQPVIHDLMSLLWVIAGIWGLIDLFMRTTGV